jgi:hypothetical protein
MQGLTVFTQYLLSGGGGDDHRNRVAVGIDGMDKQRLGDRLNPGEAPLADALAGVIGHRGRTTPTGVLVRLPGVLGCLLGGSGQNETGCQSGTGDENCTH